MAKNRRKSGICQVDAYNPHEPTIYIMHSQMQIYKKISRLFFKPLESQNRRQNFKIHKHVGEH